ncbi:MAG: class I SAM-dependent methyltransferase [Sphingomonas sp.]
MQNEEALLTLQADRILDRLRREVRMAEGQQAIAFHDIHMRALIEEGLLRRPQAVLEIGLGWGYSASALQSLGSVERHVIVEKVRGTERLTIAEENLANFSRPGTNLEIRWEDSAIALAELWREGEKFDLILIDGGHRFENVFMDFYYAGQLANPGAIVLLDDAWMPAVKTAISFFERNMPDLWTPLPMREGSALRIFAHSGKREKREWDYFVPFEMHTS